ncbi:tetratricopeptide repeat protein, partial [Acinetobacter baumannii]
LNRPDLAIADSTRSLQIDAHCTPAYDTRGVAFSLKGQYDLALADFDKYIRLKPEESVAESRSVDAAVHPAPATGSKKTKHLKPNDG